MVRKLGLATALALLILVSAGFPQSQFRELERLLADLSSHRQPPQDTEFVFARVQFTSNGPGRGPRGNHRIPGWAHDYPDGEEHILQVANEATGINLNKMSYVIVRLDSDELYRYPFAYFSEVGEMTMTEREVEHIREYFNRGGFAVVDDFDGDSLQWFENQMRLAFPNRSFVELTVDHPAFHTFYDVKTLDVAPPYPQAGPPKFYGYFDERGRLCMILDYNNDMGDFWEWIDQPMYPLEPSTEGLRFGINYLLYSLTH